METETQEMTAEAPEEIRRMSRKALVSLCLKLREESEKQKKDLLASKEEALTELTRQYEEKDRSAKEAADKELGALQSAFEERLKAREEELAESREKEVQAERDKTEAALREKEALAQEASRNAEKLEKQIALLEAANDQLTQENAALRKTIEEKDRELGNRIIRMEEAGTIAEAAFDLNNVLTDAQNAARQYLDSIKDLEARRQAAYDRVTEDARAAMAQKKQETEAYCRNLLAKTEADCAQKVRDTEAACRAREAKTDEVVEGLRERIRGIMTARSGLDSFLNDVSEKE